MRLFTSTVTLLFLTNCATVSHENVFSNVTAMVADRTGYAISYAPKEDEVSAAIKEYLKNGLSQDDAIRIALLNNQDLQAAYEKLGIQRGELIDAGLLRNPVFEAEVHFTGGGIGKGTNLNLVEEFVSVFQLPLRKKVAAASLHAAIAEVTEAVVQLIHDTEVSFYSLQAAVQLQEEQRKNLDAFDASLEIAKRQRQAGNNTELQYLNEATAEGSARREFALASAALFDQREKLIVLLGLTGSEGDWKVTPALDKPPQYEALGSALQSTALRRRPELLQAQYEIEALGAELGITGGFRLLPDFQLGVDAEGEDRGSVTIGPNLALPIPVFNQGQGTIVKSQSRLREAQRHYQAECIEVRSEVRRAQNRMDMARAQIEYDEKQLLPLFHQSTRQSATEYQGMLLSAFDFLKTKQAEIDARKAYIEELRDYWIAKADLKRAVGGSLEEREVARNPIAQIEEH